jgi:hypothetical protein
MREAAPHYNAKMRMYALVMSTEPKPRILNMEHVYTNPFNETGDSNYDWRFDVYFESKYRKVAIEIDDKVGHTSKRSFQKRQAKKIYLNAVGVELFGFPRKWVVGRKAFNDDVFLEELHLKKEEATEWYSKKTW